MDAMAAIMRSDPRLGRGYDEQKRFRSLPDSIRRVSAVPMRASGASGKGENLPITLPWSHDFCTHSDKLDCRAKSLHRQSAMSSRLCISQVVMASSFAVQGCCGGVA